MRYPGRMAAAVALLAAATGACATTDGGPDVNQEGTNDARQTESEPPYVPPDDGVEQFGDTFTYDDGLSVQLRRPKPYHPSEYAMDGREPYDLAFTVEIVNGTHTPYDPSMANCTAQSGNREASQIFDSPRLAGPPATSLLPGREVTYRIGFSVRNRDDLVVEFTPGFEYQSVLYDLHEDPTDG